MDIRNRKIQIIVSLLIIALSIAQIITELNESEAERNLFLITVASFIIICNVAIVVLATKKLKEEKQQ